MKSPSFALLSVGTLLLFCSGCSLVYCEQPFGKPLPGNELKQFEGEWLLDHVIAVASGKEKLVAAYLRFDTEREEFVATNTDLHIRQHGDERFLFIPDSPQNRYWMILIQEITATKITCRLADVAKFHSLLDQGQVKGKRHAETKSSGNLSSIVVDLNDESFAALLKHASIEELFPSANKFTIERHVPPSKKQRSDS